MKSTDRLRAGLKRATERLRKFGRQVAAAATPKRHPYRRPEPMSQTTPEPREPIEAAVARIARRRVYIDLPFFAVWRPAPRPRAAARPPAARSRPPAKKRKKTKRKRRRN